MLGNHPKCKFIRCSKCKHLIVFASHSICPVLCACEQFYIQWLLVLPEQRRNLLKYSHKRFFPQVSLGIHLLQASSLYLESTVTMEGADRHCLEYRLVFLLSVIMSNFFCIQNATCMLHLSGRNMMIFT